MFSSIEKSLLTELLALAPIPEQALSYHELMGFLFGVAITPEEIPDKEWMPAVFGDTRLISAADQARGMHQILAQIYAVFMARKTQGDLKFPFQIETLAENELHELLEWVSGFEEALELRPELWEPESNVDLTPRKKEELFFSMMVIQGLVDPNEIMPFFEKMPDQILAEMFYTFETGSTSREHQAQAFLLATLPLAIQTLQEHGQHLAGFKGKQASPQSAAESTKAAASDAALPAVKKKKSNIIRVDFNRRDKGPKADIIPPVYQLKVGLKRTKPPIWRRVLVPGETTLAQLHLVIQLTMGWQDLHLHHFEVSKTYYGPSLPEDEWAMLEMEDENRQSLFSLKDKIEPHFQYVYDFGDNWEHRITVEKLHSPEDCEPYPVLLTGRRACPPEDVGGVFGFQEFLAAYDDSEHEEHSAVRSWAGEDFQPQTFGKDEISDINALLSKIFQAD